MARHPPSSGVCTRCQGGGQQDQIMSIHSARALAVVLLGAAVTASHGAVVLTAWAQCGGVNGCPSGASCSDAQWQGMVCTSGYSCVRQDAYWWQVCCHCCCVTAALHVPHCCAQLAAPATCGGCQCNITVRTTRNTGIYLSPPHCSARMTAPSHQSCALPAKAVPALVLKHWP